MVDRSPVSANFRADLRAYWPLWLIVAAAIALRFYGLGRIPGIIGDEAWYGVQVQRLLAGAGVDWRTPTGNVPGLIQYGSLTVLHSLFPPSGLLLRIPALLSSLMAMAIAYAVARQYFGAKAGMAALVLMACLPVNLAYARLGWDPSHTGALVLCSTWAAFAGRGQLSALIFAFALTNHPAAVFAAPLLTLGFLGFDLDRRPWRGAMMRTAAFVGTLVLAILLGLALAPGASHYVDASTNLARLIDPPQWMDFFILFGRLLSGDTVYAFLAGQGFGEALPVIDAIVALALVGILAVGLIALRRRPDWRIAGTVAGWLASLVLLFFVTGLSALQPVFERFSIALVPATVLALAVLLDRCFSDDRRQGLFQATIATLALPLLAGFWLFLLQPLDRGEGKPSPGLWTGLPALNQPALDHIVAANVSTPARIVAEDYWIYWPIAYRAARQFDVIEAGGPARDPKRAGGTYWIVYRGGPLDRQLARRSDLQRRGLIESTDRRNALQIWWQPPAR